MGSALIRKLGDNPDLVQEGGPRVGGVSRSVASSATAAITRALSTSGAPATGGDGGVGPGPGDVGDPGGGGQVN